MCGKYITKIGKKKKRKKRKEEEKGSRKRKKRKRKRRKWGKKGIPYHKYKKKKKKNRKIKNLHYFFPLTIPSLLKSYFIYLPYFFPFSIGKTITLGRVGGVLFSFTGYFFPSLSY